MKAKENQPDQLYIHRLGFERKSGTNPQIPSIIRKYMQIR